MFHFRLPNLFPFSSTPPPSPSTIHPSLATLHCNLSHLSLLLRLNFPLSLSRTLLDLLERVTPRNSDQPLHAYDALSYVWGSMDRSEKILVDGKNFDITSNLQEALLRLQDYRVPRVLWIDAICINQGSDDEKASQIPLLAEIFARAHQVIVWLGQLEDDSDIAIETIRRAGGDAELQVQFSDNGERQLHEGLDLSPTLVGRNEQCITKLLERPWFKRIWVSICDQSGSLRN